MSQGQTSLVGADKILANLNMEIQKIRGKTTAGMEAAALAVKARSQALSPVKTSNLRGSHFVDVSQRGHDIVAVVGATAFYAVYVHERLELKHKVGQAKFLETAIKENIPIILALIAKFAKI